MILYFYLGNKTFHVGAFGWYFEIKSLDGWLEKFKDSYKRKYKGFTLGNWYLSVRKQYTSDYSEHG